MIDLDETPTEQVSTLSRWPWAIAAAVVMAAALVGMVVPRPAATQPGARPLITITAVSNPGEVGVDPGAFVPTTVVWYADGSNGEAAAALKGPWRPDRPIRMLTVVAGVECAISVDGELVVNVQAPTNRVAVCVWTASPR